MLRDHVACAMVEHHEQFTGQAPRLRRGEEKCTPMHCIECVAILQQPSIHISTKTTHKSSTQTNMSSRGQAEPLSHLVQHFPIRFSENTLAPLLENLQVALALPHKHHNLLS
mmetsp:Transcript_37707/g.107831  ORF Transcript_37707/g.107831 Transcript_37707/m.107831 type:complete len:112 (-) Transcript_37707:1035-1370(-)